MEVKTFPPILETERLVLRPLRLEDADEVFEYASDKTNTQFMSWDTHLSKQDTIDFLSTVIARYKARSCYDYALTLKSENGRLIGTGGAFTLDRMPHRVEIGYILNSRYWDKGYATEAMRAVIDHFFEELDVHRVDAMHFSQNYKSGNVMKRLGMQYEGSSIDNMFVRGSYVSCERYALINPKHKR